MTAFKTAFDITFRIVILFLAVIFGTLVIAAGAQSALAANLKTQSTITGNVLTLGDIFDGLGADKASYVLGPAPQPGQDMTLNARTLMRVALALDLQWRPANITDQITIRRAATIMKKRDISRLLKDALIAQEKLNGDYELSYSGTAPRIVLPPHENPRAQITRLDYDRDSGRFEATLVAPSKDNPLTHVSVFGRLDEIIEIPVLKQTMKQGDIISAGDIDWIAQKTRDLQHDTVLSAGELIGKTPRRMAHAAKALRAGDLEMPQIIQRGETVTIVYRQGPVLLTAKGRALQDGAKGDAVRVVNTTSNRSIEALVNDNGTVTVSTH